LQYNVEKFSIFSSANDAIFIIDTSNGQISDCNLRSTELTGYSNAELKGLHNSKLFPDEFKRDIRYFLKYNLDRNEYTINETVIKTKSNVITPVEIASGKISS
jgi:PAS domain S-box-containing protein